jgi:hypothetical protein
LRINPEKLGYWPTVLIGYYAAATVKMLLWVHRNGGFANPARHMGKLTVVTLRSATVYAAILLAMMQAVKVWKRGRNAASTSQTPKSLKRVRSASCSTHD